MTWTGNWSWTLRRPLISAFLLVHLSATMIWVLPQSPIRRRFSPLAGYYMLPLGLWQCWSMFAPDPIRDTIFFEAEVIDCNGVRYRFEFPRMANYTWWQGIGHFRFAKYNANISCEEFDVARKFAARHVLRNLNLPAEVYPVAVHLMYQVRETPPLPTDNPDPSPIDEALKPTRSLVVGTIHVESPSEVRP